MHGIDRLLASLAADGGRPCIFDGGAWHDAARLSAAIASWRRSIAVHLPHRGAVLGVQGTFSFEAIACVLAAWAERATVAFLPPGTDALATARDAQADILVSWDRHGLVQWAANDRAQAAPLLQGLREADDAGVVIFTSGSTGKPKAAVHSLSRLLRKFAAPGRPLRTLALLQLDHIAGLDALLYTLCAGGGFVIAAARTPQAVCAAIAAAQVQVLSTSPSFLRLLCLSDVAADAAIAAALASVEIVTYGSEPMDPTTLARVARLFPRARLSQKYGTTELGAPRTASESNDSLWIRIDGEGVETDVRDGVLWMRSPNQFLGYLNAPDPFDAAGWYCTGDRVERRGEWLRIVGREGELISVGGEKVAPAQVEAVILELDDVLAAAVRGEPNPLLGQVVMARVTLRPGASVADAERRIRRHCRARLPGYQVPVAVEVVATLVSDRQKVLRRDSGAGH